MQAEQVNAGLHVGITSSCNEVFESATNVIPFRRKPGQRYANATYFGDKSPRLVEDVDVRMLRESHVGKAATLMVPRHDIDRDATIGYALERFEGLPDHATGRARAIEHIATVDHEIHFAIDRRLERGGEVREEIMPTTSSIDARVNRQVEAEVRVCEEQDPDDVAHDRKLALEQGSEAPLTL